MNVEDFDLDQDVALEVETRRRRRGVVVSVRLDSEDAGLLFAQAEQSGSTVSEVARKAIHAYLHNPTRVSLEWSMTFRSSGAEWQPHVGPFARTTGSRATALITP